MAYEELLEKIYAELPFLRGMLHSPRVIYVKEFNKAYITFHSNVLVEEKAFLALEKLLRAQFPKCPVSLRVVSPELKDDFFEHIELYKPLLTDFLKRNYPASTPWIDMIDWRAEGDRVTLTFPDEFSLQYMSRQNVAARLAKAIKDIFSAEAKVELTVSGDQEARIEALKQKREEEMSHAYSMEELRARYKQPAPSAQAQAPARKKPKAVSPVKKQAAIPVAEQNIVREPLIPTMTNYALDRPIIGRPIADQPVEIRELTGDTGKVVIQGDIFKREEKELKGGEMLLLTIGVTDYTSSILCKCFFRFRPRFGKSADNTEPPPITDEERKVVMDKVNAIKNGMNVKIRGNCLYDSYAREISISVNDLVPMEKIEREDDAEEKRVELHLHTQMSTMDALVDISKVMARAAKWGHPAIAVTDHGSLQAFPDAFKAAKTNKIKLIPGCEGYMINDQAIVTDPQDLPLNTPVVVLDFETTGLNTRTDRVIEIGAVKLIGDRIADTLSVLVDPGRALSAKITEITGITDSMLEGQPKAETAIPQLMEFIGDCPIAAHNASFDVSMLRNELTRLNITWTGMVIDTLSYGRKAYPTLKTHKLGTLCKHCGISLKNAHRAVHDATATAHLLACMNDVAKERGLTSYADLNTSFQEGAIGESYHIILLAKTQEGLVNLNRLVSISNLDYFRRRPHMPKKMIQKYREGLIIGSACEAGELFRAILAGESHDKVKKIARFYDYLEIQPIGNNAFLVRNGTVKDDEGLRDLNRQIVALGEELGIPVCATGDVHFFEPHDAINRAILQAGMGFDDADLQPPLYFKTTEEMLEEFSYLGAEKAYEVVVTNTRKIADQVDALRLFPRHPKDEDTFQPVWDDAADNIQDMTWQTAIDWYGSPLPDLIVKRLKKELSSIVGYGFCTLYNIAERLVTQSISDGYLVGSRGSVGSSFVATMCGITEVNPLPPHYRCKHCHRGYFDVDSDTYHVGMDLPDADCPICGLPLTKDGYDIPFEVFLGFAGDKVPDIDLNFSDEYQSRAHHHVEDLFGHDHVFRAGTISGLQDKTAYGYVSKYLEERGIHSSDTEKDRLVGGCVGVKRTTGQHPGGMVVVPKEYEIYQFTAVQHPADDLDSDFITTHFDFNSMHDILVKLDCLGHLDPTMMHKLEELTGIHYKDVPLDDVGVRSLFHSPHALGLTEQELGCSTGTYGVPEFGTSFVRNMLDQTQPTTMEELIRISGLSHGTDVWTGNAADLVASGTATLSECVCCRDDIMNYLIKAGVAPKMAFTTMESVRKGKGLKPEMEQAMRDANVADWFMDSCKKIKYMFPKGHAVAYVTMSLRVAWFKLHYPLAYYCAYFTVRGNGFDATKMCLDPEGARRYIAELKARKGTPEATPKDDAIIPILELVMEMGLRGIRFLPADLYRSEAEHFTIEDGNLRVPFASLGGLGVAAAQSIVAARAGGEFLSVEDLRERAHISNSVVDLLRAQGALVGLPETSQLNMLSMF